MSSRASTSRSHGWTTGVAHPSSAMQTVANTISFRMGILWSLSGGVEQVLERRFVFAFLRLAKAHERFDHLSVAIENEGAGHALHLEPLGEFAHGIENDFELDGNVTQELVGVAALGVHVHADDREAARAV